MPPKEGGTGGEDPTRDARFLGGALLAATFASASIDARAGGRLDGPASRDLAPRRPPSDEGAAGCFSLVSAQGATRSPLRASVDAGAEARFDEGAVGCFSRDLVVAPRRFAAPGAAPSPLRLAGGLQSLLRGLLATLDTGDVVSQDLFTARCDAQAVGCSSGDLVVAPRRFAAPGAVPSSLRVSVGLEILLRRFIAALDTEVAVWVERALRSLLVAPGAARLVGILAADAASASLHVFDGSRLMGVLSAAISPSGTILTVDHIDQSLQIQISEGSAISEILHTDDDEAPVLLLPSDILTIIFLLLSPKDALSFKLACKHICLSTPRMIHQMSSPLLLLVDQLCSRPFSLFSSEMNMRFVLPYEFRRAEVKLLSSEGDVVLLESDTQLFLLNLSNGCKRLLHMPSEPFTSLILQVLASSSFQIIGLSSPNPFNLRFGYSEGEICEEELLPNNNPFELSVISGSVLIEDELYCLGVDGSVGHYSREHWEVIPSNQGLAFDISDAYLFVANNSLSCLLLGRNKIVALVLDFELGMWQRMASLEGLSVVSGTLQSFSFQADPSDTIKLAFFRGQPDMRSASTAKLGDSFVILVDEADETCWRNYRSLLMQLEFPNNTMWKAGEYDVLTESIWVKLSEVLVMTVV